MSMCVPCRQAGAFNRAASEYADRELYPFGGSLVAPAQEHARRRHEQCEYPASCTCQHVVSFSAINKGQPK